MEKGFRDCGDSSNKCQNIFLLKKSKGGLPDSIPTAMEMKNSRSPPKKREYPRMYAGQTIQQATTLGMLAAVGGVDFANHAAEFSPRTFVANVSTKAIAPLISREECNESAAKVKQEPSGVVFSKRNYEDEDDESVGFGARGYRRTECEVEHVVCRDDEKYVKSESLKSDKNNKRKFSACSEFDWSKDNEVEDGKRQKYISVKDQMFETFQPWALKTYGDQAKTKTITSRKKNRILKALDGKEHSKPDSSKFRFWVKSKGFRTQRPDNFLDNSKSMDKEWEWSEGKIGTQKDHIELYVASTVKVFGETVYRKVAVVEDFFDIIYDVHVEQGGRNGRHAGQKRTYRIITETYAFLPREAVTKFLGSCPSCMKNLRPFSPGRLEITLNDSSSEYEALNYSSPNESSMDSIQLGTIKTMRRKVEGKISPLVLNSFRENADSTSKSLTFKTGCDIEAIKNSIVSFPGNVSSKIDVLPKTLDYRFRAHENSVYNKELEVEIGQLGKKDFSFSEKFRIQNLLKTDGESEGNSQFGKIISSSVQIKSERESVKEQLMRSSCMPYDKTSHPYQYLSSKYSVPVRRNSFALADRKYIKSPIPHSDVQDLNTSLDLRMKRPPNVSINIGNSWTADTSSNLKFSNEHLSHPRNWDDITTVDLLINISNANNKLKVSRQHCHLKGPNLSRAGKTMIPANVFSASSSHLVDGKGTKVEECAINLSKKSRNESAERGLVSSTTPPKMSEPLDLNTVKPITSTYLRMTRSYGLSDQDALRIDDLEPLPTPVADPVLPDPTPDEAYAGLMKDADKLKLMLLAWNYQNSNAIRNGSEAPDLGVVGGLWAQYQNALALNAKQPSLSPVNRAEQSSPIENQDETNSSGQKEEDDGSDDDSDDKMDQNARDPERLKAFNMFVRLFVDENLDRMIPISKQPKEKIQAIIDSCARQFPEFCERSRKRIRTYLKSCRRNKKAREGWDNTSRPTPAHLTSVQAEQILAMACENESMNAKRMRIGLDPISQSLPLAGSSTGQTDSIGPSITYPGFRATPSTTTVSTTELDTAQPSTTIQSNSSARSSPISLTTNPPISSDPKPPTPVMNGTVSGQMPSPLYRPTDFTSPSSTSSPYSSSARPAAAYPTFFQASSSANATPTDLSMKPHTPLSSQQPGQPLVGLPTSSAGSSAPNPTRPPLLSHKLNPNEMSAVRQLITGYRESAAFLLRSADELEQLLLQQQ